MHLLTEGTYQLAYRTSHILFALVIVSFNLFLIFFTK